MKFQLGQIIKCQSALQKITSASYLNVKTIYGAAKAIKQISQEFDIYNKEMRKSLRDLGEVIQIPDPKDPSRMIDNPSGKTRIKKENISVFEKRREELETIEINVYDFTIFMSDIAKHNENCKEEKDKFTVGEIADLLPWIIDDLNEEGRGKVEVATKVKPIDNTPEPAPTC